ncbi:unnamed protein product [Caenorhabditis bovis]|uniref:NADAR domain-containing protein n=1 Tax=Caenorhabditis bovis TaxID=2654633 RepID=A0A8S1EK52_9PELO|nr:unnamed protein product [Caenorhabditis bovis]
MAKGKKIHVKKEPGLATSNDLVPIDPLSTSEVTATVKDEPSQANDSTNESTTSNDKFPSFSNVKNVTNPTFNSRGRGRAYRPNGSRKPFRVFVPKQTESSPPETLITKEYKISPENILCFFGTGHFISALFPSQITLDGNEYNSVEHYYQACKLFTLAGKEAAAQTKTASTPLEVKQIAKRLLQNVPKYKVDEWKNTYSVSILKHAILNKFQQNEELQKKLLDTGEKILIQSYHGDSFYAVGANDKYTIAWAQRNKDKVIKVPFDLGPDNFKYVPVICYGKNLLGFITMQVRDEIRLKKNEI